MTLDPRVRIHQDWLGMVQPTGLFLAPRVLADAGAAPTDPIIDTQGSVAELVTDGALRDPLGAFREVFAWPDAVLLHGETLPADVALSLDGGVRVVPDFALRDLDEPVYVLLGMIVAPDVALDAAYDDPAWTASAHQRFERLLRARECPVGVLTNHRSVRIVYAPKGEATAHATWTVRDLLTVAGRPMLAALHMCLNARRLLTLDGDQRLPALLARSREFQNTVSTKLQGQVLDALQELLDGLQRADRVTDGRLLAPWRASDDDRQGIYRGLVTALLRMVFVLFAEERRLLPLDARRYRESYALTNLHARLQDDHARLGARLDARYGAWARVVALFRLLHDGLDAKAIPDGFSIPPRRGEFFDPDRFAFLEGRAPGPRALGPLELPKISDGTVFRALDKLLVLDGERLKYSDLAVEQIGSVYEGIMGYTLELAEGRALRIRLGTALDVVVDLQRFADLARKEFIKHLTDDLGLKLSDGTAKAMEKAAREDDVAAILSQQKTFKNTTAIERGWMFLQPGEERRRSGSHYTPRSLTQPIVERTLAPVLAAMGEHPTPEAILALRVCDPAMGSGAFLVEVCRQLATRLEAAWKHHDAMPTIPPDEDPHLHARRRVAQRCLYGVDRNPLAVDLARLSLWLETFARDHAFTFVDHCLRHGDSLVGLSLDQIASVSLDTRKGAQLDLVRKVVNDTLARVRELRREIHEAGDGDPPDNEGQRSLWREAQDALLEARTVGDVVVAGFFSQKNDKDRAKWVAGQHAAITAWLTKTGTGEGLRGEVRRVLGARGIVPFHWPLEFPEVFDGTRGGFDAFVGNPPFVGGSKISGTLGRAFPEWLKQLHEESHGNADLVAHFFRRAFGFLRDGGTFGLIATNTISQGDTRSAGLRWICTNGGTIYEARRRYKWPGIAAVVVSVVYVLRGAWTGTRRLDSRDVPEITAFLFHRGGHDNPALCEEVAASHFTGSKIYGPGFTFDDQERKRDSVSSLADMQQLIGRDARNQERIFPYLGGEELNEDPEQKHHRFVINFGEMNEGEAREWPDLMAIVESKVKPGRVKGSDSLRSVPWWLFERPRGELYRSIRAKSRVLVTSQTSAMRIFAFVTPQCVFSHKIVIFSEETSAFFAVMQSRLHVDWAAFFGSTMKDDPVYTPSDCFVTFPFPRGWESSVALDDIGRRYDVHRAAIMKRTIGTKKPEGLTATYNRFHDPNERSADIATLRALHAEMDRAVLDAYGWTDLRPVYDYRVQLDERVRYTWDDDTRDEVLARLLEENRQRA
ncbi:MAG: class I SAM-dependent DNA methyltransferase, partial [Myxococcaceae bacterium]